MSFLEQGVTTSDILLMGFAGYQAGKTIPSFHWLGAFEHLPVRKLFVRDLNQMLYQHGIPGVAAGALGVGDYLRDYVRQHGIRGTVALGTSAGGYAALLYGYLIGADEVHAFSPVTRLPTRSPAQMIQLVFHRNWTMFSVQWKLYTDRNMDRETMNLSRFMATGNGRTRYHIYYGTGHERDRRHSQWMAEVPGVVLHEYDEADHHLVTHLRESGELARIVEAACFGEPKAEGLPSAPKCNPRPTAEHALR